MEPLIIAPEKEYRGKYVALQSFADNTVIGSGENVTTALKSAREKGVASPVLVHVPAEKTLNLFNLF